MRTLVFALWRVSIQIVFDWGGEEKSLFKAKSSEGGGIKESLNVCTG